MHSHRLHLASASIGNTQCLKVRTPVEVLNVNAIQPRVPTGASAEIPHSDLKPLSCGEHLCRFEIEGRLDGLWIVLETEKVRPRLAVCGGYGSDWSSCRSLFPGREGVTSKRTGFVEAHAFR